MNFIFPRTVFKDSEDRAGSHGFGSSRTRKRVCKVFSKVSLLTVDTSSFQFLDPLALMSFTRCMCVFFVLELVRRLVQSWRNAFDDLRLVAMSAAALIVLLLDLLFVKENKYSFPVLSMVFTAYVAFISSPWGLVRLSADYGVKSIDFTP